MFGIALTYLDNNELLSIALLFTWLLSTIYQIIDIKRDWRIMYIYEHGFVVGGFDYYEEEKNNSASLSEGVHEITVNSKVYQVEIIDKNKEAM